MIETNTFNSSAPSLADYGLESCVAELNLASARLARSVADEVAARTGQPRFVAGVLGPHGRTASISPDVNDPGMRNVSFDELVFTYIDAVRALLEGGCRFHSGRDHIRHTECQGGALRDCQLAGDALGLRVPVMLSGTIADESGRTPVGQTPEAFWNSLRHINPFVVGLNCALGAQDLRPHVERAVARGGYSHQRASQRRTAGCGFGGSDDTPEAMATQ